MNKQKSINQHESEYWHIRKFSIGRIAVFILSVLIFIGWLNWTIWAFNYLGIHPFANDEYVRANASVEWSIGIPFLLLGYIIGFGILASFFWMINKFKKAIAGLIGGLIGGLVGLIAGFMVGLIGGLIGGLMGGLVGLIAGFIVGLAGLIAGFIIGLIIGFED